MRYRGEPGAASRVSDPSRCSSQEERDHENTDPPDRLRRRVRGAFGREPDGDDLRPGRRRVQVERPRRLDPAAQRPDRAGRVPQARAGTLRRKAGPLPPPVRRARAGGVRRPRTRSRRRVPAGGARPLEDVGRRAPVHDVQSARTRVQHEGSDDSSRRQSSRCAPGRSPSATRSSSEWCSTTRRQGIFLQESGEHDRRPGGSEHPRLQPRPPALVRAARRPSADHPLGRRTGGASAGRGRRRHHQPQLRHQGRLRRHHQVHDGHAAREPGLLAREQGRPGTRCPPTSSRS